MANMIDFYKAKKIKTLFFEMMSLPKVNLTFDFSLHSNNVEEYFRYFNKRHPRFFIFRNKTVGVALIDLSSYEDGFSYLKSINGKNSAAYYARKAKSHGYTFLEIDKSNFIENIHEINNSAEARQGRLMDQGYRLKTVHYEAESNFNYYGVTNREGKLVAYCDFGYFGNFAVISKLLGHKQHLNYGIMNLMLSEIIIREIASRKVEYVMYDMMFGASLGLQLFKSKLGFQPRFVTYSIKNKS